MKQILTKKWSHFSTKSSSGNLLRVLGEKRWNKILPIFFDHKLFSPANWLTERLTCYISQHNFCLKCLSLYLQFSDDLVSLMNKSSCVEKYFKFWFCDKPASDNIGFLVSIFPHRQPCYHSTSFNIRLLDLASQRWRDTTGTGAGSKTWAASDVHTCVHPKHRSLPNGFLLLCGYINVCATTWSFMTFAHLWRDLMILREFLGMCAWKEYKPGAGNKKGMYKMPRHFIHSCFVLTISETALDYSRMASHHLKGHPNPSN